MIIPEIQDTLKQPPSAIRQMKAVCSYAISGSFFFYFIIGVAGYSALGNGKYCPKVFIKMHFRYMCQKFKPSKYLCVDVQEIVLDSFDGPRWALLISHVCILIHMLTAYQVFGQAIYNTLESHVKWFLLRREEKKSINSQPILEEAEEAEEATYEVTQVMPTPFDKAKPSYSDVVKRNVHHHNKPLLGLDHHHLQPISERLSSAVSASVTEARMSSVIHNLYTEDAKIGHKSRRSSMFNMYSIDTGFANEEVPLNDEGFVVSWPYRLVIRTSFVAFITLISCIMPFFSAFAGLVGAVTYFPLAIYFPFGCYRKLYDTKKAFSALLTAIYWVTLAVACVAVVGSARTVVVGLADSEVCGFCSIMFFSYEMNTITYLCHVVSRRSSELGEVATLQVHSCTTLN